MALERESIMLADTLDIHEKIVCLLEKLAASGCRYPVYTADYIIVTYSSQTAVKERLSWRTRSRVSRQLYTQHKSLSSIFLHCFYDQEGDYSVHAWGGFSWTPISPLSLLVERIPQPPLESKPPQMCSKIRRARQIGKQQTRQFRVSSITRLLKSRWKWINNCDSKSDYDGVIKTCWN